MKDLGTVRPGSTIYIEFDSFGASGESITLTGLAAADVEVYKDGGTTQRASDAGYTLLDTDGIDFDGVTGIHGLSISLADNTTAGFWAAGSHYRVVISSVTINSQTVSFTAATFRIGYEDAIINTTIATLASQTSFTLTSGPAEDDALNGSIVCIHDVASAVQLGYGVISDYTGSTKTVTLTAGTTFTAAATDNISIFPPVNAAYGGAVAYTATRGLAGTALPNAAAEASGGLFTRGTGAGQIAQDSNGTARVLLGDGAHGGTAAVLTLSRLIAASATTNEPAVKLTGNGTAAGILSTGGASSGAGMSLQSGGGDGTGLVAVGTGLGNGIYLAADAGGIGLGIAATTGISTNGAVSFNSFTPNFASGSITAGVIAADAIGASELAADAVTEIQSGLATASALTTLSNRLTGLVLATGTIGSTGNDTTHLHLDGLTYGDDEINNWLLVIFDVSTSEYHSRWIEDWVLSTELVTVATLPFTPQNATDTYWLLPVRQDVTGGSGLDAAGVRAAIGLASANLDTQLGAIDDYLDTEVAALTTELAKVPKSDGTATWNATALASIQTEANDAIVANNLDHLLLSAVDTDFATTVHLNSVIGHLADNGTSATFDRTTDSLEALEGKIDTIDNFLDTEVAAIISTQSTHTSVLSSIQGVTDGLGDQFTAVNGNIAGVWDHATADHTTAGTFGKATSDILVDTAEIGAAGAGLTNINLPNQTMDIVGNITGNLSGSVGSVTGAINTAAGTITTLDALDTAQDTQHSTTQGLVTTVDTVVDAILADTGTDGVVLSTATKEAIATALLDLAAGVETNRTLRQALRLILATSVGKLSGAATTTVTIRDTNDGTNRVVATVDADGNRSAVTLDAS